MIPKQIDMGDPYFHLTDRYGALWVFETARYTVALFAEEEDLDPAGSFQFKRDIRYARTAADGHPSRWFQAAVAVYGPDGKRIGLDTLGGCSYRNFKEFYAGHRDKDPMNRNCTFMRQKRTGSPTGNITICHYFPDMVRQAIADARTTLAKHRDGEVSAA